MNMTHLSDKICIDVLEDLIETEFKQSLHRVAEECRRPALGQFAHTRFGQRYSEPLNDATIFARVNLNTAFHQIERNDGRVGRATAKNTTKAAQCIIVH